MDELSSVPGLAAHARLITRVHRLQLLPAADVRVFEASLMPHQKAVSYSYRVFYITYILYMCIYTTVTIATAACTCICTIDFLLSRYLNFMMMIMMMIMIMMMDLCR